MNLNPENKLSPQKGRLLVSQPFMDDPYFKRTVVLLCDYDEEGAFGFILNKYIDLDLSESTVKIPGIGQRLAVGGPVENKNIFYLHKYGNSLEGSIHIVDDLYIGGDFKELFSIVEADADGIQNVRFFIGYSGWSAQQLDHELAENAWYVAEAKTAPIMNSQDNELWSIVLKNMGRDFAHLANFPDDPKLN